jgi:hypothetical protein
MAAVTRPRRSPARLPAAALLLRFAALLVSALGAAAAAAALPHCAALVANGMLPANALLFSAMPPPLSCALILCIAALLLGTALHPHRAAAGALAAPAALPTDSLLAVAVITDASTAALTAAPIAVALQLGTALKFAALLGTGLRLGRRSERLLVGAGMHAVALLLATATLSLLASLQPTSRWRCTRPGCTR